MNGAEATKNGFILFYHRVAQLASDTYGLCVSPEDFREHMKELRSQFCPMPLDQLLERAAASDLPPGALAVTLDDGYLDNLTNASPILLEFGIPATFFVTTSRIKEKHEFWWDTLERIFLSSDTLPPILDLYDDGSRLLPTVTGQERVDTHSLLTQMFYGMSHVDRDALISRISVWSGIDLSPRETHRPMVASEISTLAGKEGHAIGCHTANHLNLPMQSIETQFAEIIESKKDLETILGDGQVRSFSYPYGAFNPQVVDMVASASFDIAVTVEGRVLQTGINPLLLPRFEIKGDVSFAERVGTISGVLPAKDRKPVR